MSNAMYSRGVLEALHSPVQSINSYGSPVWLKQGRDEKRAGYLEPSLLHILEEEEKEKEREGNPYSLSVELVREKMGYPNLNLNRAEIITKLERLHIDGREVEVWRYYKRKGDKRPKPALVFFHGGAWIGGSVYAVENFCKLIAELADAVVFNVDYALAPENPFPAGFDDCYYAAKDVYENHALYGVDKNKITIGGDSAGGNLAAAVCLKARDSGDFPLAHQFLVYPGVLLGEAAKAGFEWSKEVYTVAPEHEKWIGPSLMLGSPPSEGASPPNLLLSDQTEAENPYVSPMLASSHSNLPPALILVAEFDGLRQQGEYYAAQLAGANVEVKTLRYQGCTHAFIDYLGYVPQAEDACIEIARSLQRCSKQKSKS